MTTVEYLYIFLIWAAVFLLPIRKMGWSKAFSLYMLILALGFTQILILIPNGILYSQDLISVETARIISFCLVYPLTEECFKYYYIQKSDNPKTFFFVAWAIAGFESFFALIANIHKDPATGRPWADIEKPTWVEALMDTLVIRGPSIAMHLVTCYIIWYFIMHSKRPRVGVFVAFCIHAIFNYFSGSLLKELGAIT